MEETRYVQTAFEKEFNRETVLEDRKMRFIISTSDKDRHRTVLNMDNWELDNYNSNGIVGYQHNVYGDNMCVPPNPDDVIGKSVVEVDKYKGKKALIADVEFEPKEMNETADKVLRKLVWGSLNAASVGFLEVGQGREETVRDSEGNVIDRTYFFHGQELLEWSVVNIPSNPKALKKSLRNHTMAAFDFLGRLMPNHSINDIRKMRVQEILDELDVRFTDPPLEQVEKTLSGADPNLNFYQQRLFKLKNGQA